jgi:hypothetical protein
MHAIEFEANLSGKKAIAIPREAADQLASVGKAKVIILFDSEAGDPAWRKAAYEHFMKDDEPEDSIYDRFTEDR